jgi:hypothetical protein
LNTKTLFFNVSEFSNLYSIFQRAVKFFPFGKTLTIIV